MQSAMHEVMASKKHMRGQQTLAIQAEQTEKREGIEIGRANGKRLGGQFVAFCIYDGGETQKVGVSAGRRRSVHTSGLENGGLARFPRATRRHPGLSVSCQQQSVNWWFRPKCQTAHGTEGRACVRVSSARTAPVLKCSLERS